MTKYFMLIAIISSIITCSSSVYLFEGEYIEEYLEYGYSIVAVDSQAVDLRIHDADTYLLKVRNTGMEGLIGSDLFFHLCANCHHPNMVFDTTDFYKTNHDLNSIILRDSNNHGDWHPRKLDRLDTFDVLAISRHVTKYIK